MGVEHQPVIFIFIFSVEFGNLDGGQPTEWYHASHRCIGFLLLMPWPFVAVEERDPVPCGLTDFSWEVDGITKRRATVIYWLFTNGIPGSLCHGL